MSHRQMVALLTVLAMAAPAVRADDPPDRLEKKPTPMEPKQPVGPPKPGEKPADEKDRPKADPMEDAEKLREKIAADMQAAEKKLKERDAGPDTREAQDRALKNIDKLIDLAKNPPPPPQQPPMDGSPPPMGGEGQGGKSQSRPQSGQSRREQRQQRRQQSRGKQQQGRHPQQTGAEQGGEQTGSNVGQPGKGGMGTQKQPEHVSDVVKDIWGHLPETLRQEMDHYYRDRFMPRYRDLLQEYYSRIAERDRAREGGR